MFTKIGNAAAAADAFKQAEMGMKTMVDRETQQQAFSQQVIPYVECPDYYEGTSKFYV